VVRIEHGQAAFREAVEECHKAGLPATCRAELEADLNDDEGYVDVFISARPSLRSDDEPFLPPCGGTRVHLDEGEAERLDESLHSRAKTKKATRLGELLHTPCGWRVSLDGQPIGTLETERYQRIEEARAAGFPLTCWVDITRAQGKPLRVIALVG